MRRMRERQMGEKAQDTHRKLTNGENIMKNAVKKAERPKAEAYDKSRRY
jgi:hypothetical protein